MLSKKTETKIALNVGRAVLYPGKYIIVHGTDRSDVKSLWISKMAKYGCKRNTADNESMVCLNAATEGVS